MGKTKMLTIAALILAALFCSGYLLSGNGYLNRYAEQNMLLSVLPPPIDSAEQRNDKAVFLDTRASKDSPRWQQAVIDAEALPDDVLKGFSCATGRDLNAENMPYFKILLTKALADTGRLVRKSKKQFKVSRPFHLYGGETCTRASGYDYPSGHSMVGWTMAKLLAQYYPEKKDAIYMHARSIAESRVICGVHSVSAVEVDEFYSDKILARIKRLPAFQKDFKAAKLEMLSLKPSGYQNRSCEKYPPKYVKPYSAALSTSL
ncbi:acid phosphatase [Bartonella sp. LJL80]